VYGAENLSETCQIRYFSLNFILITEMGTNWKASMEAPNLWAFR